MLTCSISILEYGMKILILTLVTIFAFNSYGAVDNALTLFAYPPKKELNWKSPKSAIMSFMEIDIVKVLFPGEKIKVTDTNGEEGSINENYRSTMGHTITHVSCMQSNQQEFDAWTSFSGEDFSAVDKRNIFTDKLGLGILFYDYQDGHIIDGQENIKRLIYYKANKRNGTKTKPRYLKILIDQEQCDQVAHLVNFFRSFKHPKDMTLEELEALPSEKKLYFTTNIDPYDSYQKRLQDPNTMVGGGCAPYGIAMLKTIGEFDSYFDSIFKLNLDIGISQIGEKNKNPISIFSILFGKKGTYWALPNEPIRTMSQYDPNLIWKFMGNLYSCLNGSDDSCKLVDSDWKRKNSYRLQAGEDITFSDTILVKERDMNSDRGENILVPKTTTVNINGVILGSK